MNALEREYVRQYARCWQLLKAHPVDTPNHAGQLMGPQGYDLLLDVANLRQRDIEHLREEATMRGSA